MFDATQFYQDHNIPYWTEGKNVQKGWVNIKCPFCGDTSNHFGYNLNKGYTNCWLCGWHHIESAIVSLLDCSVYEALKIRNDYSTSRPKLKIRKTKRPTTIELPLGCRQMGEMHKNYLKKRNFDPAELESEFDLMGCGYVGDYKFRIIAPIYFNGKLVSYQGRATNNKTSPKHKACKKTLEIIDHKTILYNIDNCKNDKVVIVEGIADCWRMGHNSIATFGTGFTQEQILLIKQRFSEAFILFDFNAQEQADQLAAMLSGIGMKITIIDLADDDPAEMSDKQAKKLMREVLE